MKTYLAFVLLAAFVSVPAVADENKQQDKDTGMPMGGNMGGMMGNQDQKMMQSRRQEMAALIQQIESETNPQKRQELMVKHMTQMQDTMRMMYGTSGKGDNTANMMKMPMEERLSMMEGRMSMMQMMMDQMVSHNAQNEMPMRREKK